MRLDAVGVLAVSGMAAIPQGYGREIVPTAVGLAYDREQQVDELVYELYGLTAEEIAIVQGMA
jgi:hypothetical protein